MKAFELGVLDLVPVLQGVQPQIAIQQAVLLAQAAEKSGYTRYWVSEHHDMEHLASSCPEVLLAHIGAHTKRIRIGSGAVLLPYYKPYKVAEAFHLLSTLHPGRIDLGIGRAPGGSSHVSMALSDNYLEQVLRLPDRLKDLTALLANEFRIEEQPVAARPIPPVPPQLWLLGTNVKSAQYAARFGAGYVFGQFMSDRDGADIISAYRDEYRPSRWSREPRAIVAVGVVCAETEKEAKRLAADGMNWAGQRAGYGEEKAADYSGRTIVGTPEQVTDELGRMKEKYGVSEFMVVTAIADYAKRIRSYELLAQAAFQ